MHRAVTGISVLSCHLPIWGDGQVPQIVMLVGVWLGVFPSGEDKSLAALHLVPVTQLALAILVGDCVMCQLPTHPQTAPADYTGV